MTGDGLVRGIGAPPGGNLPIGVQPGVNSAIIIANKVIVFGTGGGVFVYSGTPGPGNPPITWMSNSSTDPYGNALPDSAQLGLAGSGIFAAGNQLITTKGIFTYPATPGPGGLAQSVVPGAVTVTDPFGNAALPGFTTYQFISGTWYALNILSSQMVVWTAPASTGPYTQSAAGIFFLTGANTFINALSGQKIELSAPTKADFALEVAGALTADSTISATAGAVTLTGGTAGAPSLITTDTWHAIGLLNSWANNGSFAASRYKKMENNSVRVQGVINATAATAATFFTLPAGYIPTSASGAPVGCNAGAGANTVPTLRWDTSGNLTINNLTIPSASAVFFTQDIPLD